MMRCVIMILENLIVYGFATFYYVPSNLILKEWEGIWEAYEKFSPSLKVFLRRL